MNKQILLIVPLFLFSIPILPAQDRIESFQKRWEERWDDVKPKGKLLKQIRETIGLDESNSKAKNSSNSNSAPAEPVTSGRQPSPNAANDSGLFRGRPLNPSDANAVSSRRNAQPPTKTPANQARANGLVAEKGVPNPKAIRFGVAIDERDSGKDGLLVLDVESNSPAAAAKIQPGDRLVTLAGLEMNSVHSLDEILAALSAGDQVMAEILRRDETIKTLVSFGQSAVPSQGTLPADVDHSFAAPAPPSLQTVRPPLGRENLNGELSSVLAPPRQLPQPNANSNSAYPSTDFLPAVTGSAVQRGVAPSTNNLSSDPRLLQAEILRQQQVIQQLRTQLEQLQRGNPTSDNWDELPPLSPNQ